MQMIDHIHAIKHPFEIVDPAGNKIPRSGKEAYRVMDESLKYLQRIHSSVLHEVRQDPGLDTMKLCRRVLADLGLPETMANPLVAASFQASKTNEACSRPDLLKI